MKNFAPLMFNWRISVHWRETREGGRGVSPRRGWGMMRALHCIIYSEAAADAAARAVDVDVNLLHIRVRVRV